MEAFISQYIPEIMSFVIAIVSAITGSGMMGYVIKHFNALREDVRNDKEIKEIRSEVNKVVKANLELAEQNAELKKALADAEKARLHIANTEV